MDSKLGIHICMGCIFTRAPVLTLKWTLNISASEALAFLWIKGEDGLTSSHSYRLRQNGACG